MEPDGVVEARTHERVPIAAARVREHRDTQEVLVGEVRERARVHRGIVAELLGHAHPGDLLGDRLSHRSNDAMSEEQIGRRVREVVGGPDVGRWQDRLTILAVLGPLEARDQVQDGPTGLVRDHLAGRERAAVPHALDLVEHGLGLGAGTDEVRVERVHPQLRVHGETGRAQCLGDDLTAVETAPSVPGRGAEERVGLHPFQLEQRRDIGRGMHQHAHALVNPFVGGAAKPPRLRGDLRGDEFGVLDLPFGLDVDAVAVEQLGVQ